VLIPYIVSEQVLSTTNGVGGFTRIPLGIDTAVNVFTNDGRRDVPKILIVITDGVSNGGGSVFNSSNAAR